MVQGFNLSAFERGLSVQNVRAYWPTNDLIGSVTMGIDHVRIPVDPAMGTAAIASTHDLINRTPLSILPILNCHPEKPLTLDSVKTFWQEIGLGLGTRVVLDILNEPEGLGFPTDEWRQSTQPEMYSFLHGMFPHNPIMLSPGGGHGTGYGADYQGPMMWLPPSTDRNWMIGFHDYPELSGPEVETPAQADARLGRLVAWGKQWNIPQIVLSEVGVGDGTPQLARLQSAMTYSPLYRKHGLPFCVWMNKMLLTEGQPRKAIPEAVAAWGMTNYTATFAPVQPPQ